jgi:hypothetical protein
MNVGELLKERDRLLGVLEEAKTCRSKLKQVNRLIALYGDSDHVPVTAPVPTPKPGFDTIGRRIPPKQKVKTTCPKCPGKTFSGPSGLLMHTNRVHGKMGPGHHREKLGVLRESDS